MSSIELYKAYYDDPRVSAWRRKSAVDKAANVISFWRELQGGAEIHLADIGCGDGALIREFDRGNFGVSYTGFEISESGIDFARKASYAKPPVFVLFDGDHVPARDKSFDLAILSHVIEHVECPRMLLREAARIAKYVFVEVPLELNARTPRDFHWTDVGHINLYNPLLIRHLLQSSGLRVLAERVTCPSREVFTFKRPALSGILHHAIKAAFLKVAPGLATRFFTYHGCSIAGYDNRETIIKPG